MYAWPIILVGDYNVQFDSITHCPLRLALESFMNENALDQMVNFQTRHRMVAGVMQSSQIDLLLTNIANVKCSYEYDAASDHVILIANLNVGDQRAHAKTFN